MIAQTDLKKQAGWLLIYWLLCRFLVKILFEKMAIYHAWTGCTNDQEMKRLQTNDSLHTFVVKKKKGVKEIFAKQNSLLQFRIESVVSSNRQKVKNKNKRKRKQKKIGNRSVRFVAVHFASKVLKRLCVQSLRHGVKTKDNERTNERQLAGKSAIGRSFSWLLAPGDKK